MDTITQLRGLAGDIESRRLELGISKNALCQKFGTLGSTKTFARILNLADDLEGMDIANQLANYLAALELITGYTEDPEENKIYTDFEFMRDWFVTVGEALRQTDNTRLVLVTSGSGGGKSSLCEALREDRRFKNIFYCVEASEVWTVKVTGLLTALLMEVGLFERGDKEEDKPKKDLEELLLQLGAQGMLEKLVERINGRRIIIGIDEAHHLQVAGLNVVKTLINRTKAVVILFAHPELMNRTTRASYAATSQLWQNRMYECVKIPAPCAGDVLEFFKRRGIEFATPAMANAIGKSVSAKATFYGLWKFVKRCAREARKMKDKKFTDADFAQVIVTVQTKMSLG